MHLYGKEECSSTTTCTKMTRLGLSATRLSGIPDLVLYRATSGVPPEKTSLAHGNRTLIGFLKISIIG